MKDKNICLINDSFPPTIDGVANTVVNYAAVLNGFAHASVLTPYYPDADDSVFDFPVIRYPSLDLTKPFGYRAGIPLSPEVIRRVEGEDFDLIHSHCPVTSTMLARMIRDRIRKPVVLTYHTKFDVDIANSLRGKLIRQEAIRLLAENISACDEVWTVSRGAGENLRKIGYNGDYIVMPNGIDLPKGRPEEALIRRHTDGYALPEEKPVFLFVGRMMWYKGIRIILDALARLREKEEPFTMVFVGSGGDLDEIRAYTETLGLSDQVVFVPPVYDRDQIRAWYGRADLFLFPSTFDTNGLVVREAAACGLASVLIAGSCAAEEAEDGVNAFLIEENAPSLADMLLRLCRTPETVRRVGENARETLYLSWEDSVKRAAERYDVVIEQYAKGLYPAHTTFSDEIFHATAQAMDNVTRIREQAKNLRETEAERRQERLNELSEWQDRVAKRHTRLRENIHNSIDRFL